METGVGPGMGTRSKNQVTGPVLLPSLKDDCGPKIQMVTFVVLFIFTYFFVALRMWVRSRIVRRIAADDILLLISTLFWTVLCGVSSSSVVLQQWRRGAVSYNALRVMSVAGFISYNVSNFTLKASLAIFFLRLAHQRWQRILIKGSLGVFIAFAVGVCLVMLFRCGRPSPETFSNADCHVHWQPTMYHLVLCGAILNSLLDWLFVFTPVYLIARSPMARNVRISVIALILLGTCGSIASIARIPFVRYLQVQFPVELYRSEVVRLVSVIEISTGIMTISLASTGPFIKRPFAKIGAVSAELHWRTKRALFKLRSYWRTKRHGGPNLAKAEMLTDGTTTYTAGKTNASITFKNFEPPRGLLLEDPEKSLSTIMELDDVTADTTEAQVSNVKADHAHNST